MPDNPGFSLESIRELLSIRIDPEHHTCQESKGIVQERLQEVEARIAELQSMQRLCNALMIPVVGPPIAVFIARFLKLLNKGRVALRVAVDFLHWQDYTRAVNNQLEFL